MGSSTPDLPAEGKVEPIQSSPRNSEPVRKDASE